MIDASKLIAYNIWANRKVVEQCKTLADDLFIEEVGGSFPSIRLTLLHVLQSDWIWLHRFEGIPLIDVPSDWSTDTAAAIESIWIPIQDKTRERVKQLSDTPAKLISFKTRKGVPYTLPFLDLAIHVCNHGTYHRGQIVNMIRILGENPVNTDYFIFCTHP